MGEIVNTWMVDRYRDIQTDQYMNGQTDKEMINEWILVCVHMSVCFVYVGLSVQRTGRQGHRSHPGLPWVQILASKTIFLRKE